MKTKILEVLTPALYKTEHRLRQLCGRPSPAKRLVMVLVVCAVFAVINVYFLFSSVYNIGKNDAKKELLQMEHIEGLKIPKKDSINFKQMYQYEYR